MRPAVVAVMIASIIKPAVAVVPCITAAIATAYFMSCLCSIQVFWWQLNFAACGYCAAETTVTGLVDRKFVPSEEVPIQ
jgi:hypothetical protein